ncbi:hypothetical protein Dimus_008882 [Dionaea muscipula]
MVRIKIQATATAIATAAAVLLAAWSWGTAVAQSSSIPSCGESLTPCANYLNATSTKPPSTCCDPLKQAIDTQKACLCALFNSSSLFTTLGINATQALALPVRCGITAIQTNICASAPATSPSATTSAPPPPGKNAAGRISGTGVSGLLILAGVVLLVL